MWKIAVLFFIISKVMNNFLLYLNCNLLIIMIIFKTNVLKHTLLEKSILAAKCSVGYDSDAR